VSEVPLYTPSARIHSPLKSITCIGVWGLGFGVSNFARFYFRRPIFRFRVSVIGFRLEGFVLSSLELSDTKVCEP